MGQCRVQLESVKEEDEQMGPCETRLTFLLIYWLIGGIWAETANHLLRLLANLHSLDDLDVLHAGENLVLDPEANLHSEGSALLDGKGLLLESFELSGLANIDNNIVSTLNLAMGEHSHGYRSEGMDDC